MNCLWPSLCGQRVGSCFVAERIWEMRLGDQVSKDVLSDSTLLGGSVARLKGHSEVLLASWLYGVWRTGWNIYLGGRSSGGNFWVIVPAPPSQEDGAFLSLCGLARICHGTGAWWALLCAMVGIVSKRLPSDQRFLHFFLCLWDLVLIRCMASC